MRLSDGSTGNFSEAAQAAARAAAEAAARAAAEAAARAAAEAAAKAAAEAAKRAAEAAEKAQEAAAKAHTGRLNDHGKQDMGKMPWDHGHDAADHKAPEHTSDAAKVVKDAVALAAGSVLIKGYKLTRGAHKNIEALGENVGKLRDHFTKESITVAGGAAALDEAAKAGEHGSALSKLGKVGAADAGVKVLFGVQSALDLPNAIGALKGGVTFDKVNNIVSDGLGTLRGVDGAAKLLRGEGLLGRFNPILGAVGDVSDGARRVENLSHFNKLSTKEKVANIAYLAGDAADLIGNIPIPPVDIAAKAIGAGCQLIGMAAENIDTISHAATAAVKDVDHVAHAAEHAVSNVAHKAEHAVASFIGSIF